MSESEWDENAVIRRVIDGEEHAYALIVQRFQNRLLAAMLAMVGSREDAEDLTQECFVLGFRKLRTFEGRSSLFTWLHRIGINLAISHRRKHRKETSMQRSSLDIAEEHLENREEPVDELIDRKQRESIVRQAILRLDEQHRSVLVLRDIQGLDYSDIASTLDIPIGTVRSRLHRARTELKDVLNLLMSK